MEQLQRCEWAKDPLNIEYHDLEWGVPVYDDRKFFEFLLLEFFQAGLSWTTILKKRESFRQAFDDFDYREVANYGDEKKARLLDDKGIIRNRRKIEAAVHNARVFLDIREKFGSFDEYIWSFVNDQPVVNEWKTLQEVPAHTDLSDAMSSDMKKRGFVFIGTTICYAFLQATGVVNDHIIDCFRYSEIISLYNK